jgi:hypothetical protein
VCVCISGGGAGLLGGNMCVCARVYVCVHACVCVHVCMCSDGGGLVVCVWGWRVA